MKIVYNKKILKLFNWKNKEHLYKTECLSVLKKFILWKINKEDLKISNDYIHSVWVDKHSIWEELPLLIYLNISYYISWLWLWKLSDSNIDYIVVIQYSDGIEMEEWKKSEWFNIRLYNKDWYYYHFWKNGIKDSNIPYIAIKI